MDVRTLQYFAAVVEKGGIQSAADEMYVTRQTVSHAIARLEEELGFRLFDRKNNDLSLTYPGVYFYEDACRVIEAYNVMINRARSYKEGTRTRIVFERAIGFHNELREHLLTFKKDNETWLDLEIYDKHSAACEEDILADRADVALTHTPTERFESIDTRIIHRESFRIAVGRNSELAGREVLTLEDVNREVFLHYTGGYDDPADIPVRPWTFHPRLERSNDVVYINREVAEGRAIMAQGEAFFLYNPMFVPKPLPPGYETGTTDTRFACSRHSEADPGKSKAIELLREYCTGILNGEPGQ